MGNYYLSFPPVSVHPHLSFGVPPTATGTIRRVRGSLWAARRPSRSELGEKKMIAPNGNQTDGGLSR